MKRKGRRMGVFKKVLQKIFRIKRAPREFPGMVRVGCHNPIDGTAATTFE